MPATATPWIRRPAVAGYYYAADPSELREAINAITQGGAVPRAACAVVVPHDSYPRSGAIAGAALSQVVIPRRCVVLGPSHTGHWARWSLMAAGTYRTPLGDVPVDEARAEALRARCPFLEMDAWAQRGEHAIEVVLPFLQRLGPADLTVVPIIMGTEDRGEISRLAGALAHVVGASDEATLLVASSNLSQYESHPRAVERDRALIGTICGLDSIGLFRTLEETGTRMCGSGAVACVLEAAVALGAQGGHVARYGTSADAEGDPDSVTGYAGVIIS